MLPTAVNTRHADAGAPRTMGVHFFTCCACRGEGNDCAGERRCDSCDGEICRRCIAKSTMYCLFLDKKNADADEKKARDDGTPSAAAAAAQADVATVNEDGKETSGGGVAAEGAPPPAATVNEESSDDDGDDENAEEGDEAQDCAHNADGLPEHECACGHDKDDHYTEETHPWLCPACARGERTTNELLAIAAERLKFANVAAFRDNVGRTQKRWRVRKRQRTA